MDPDRAQESAERDQLWASLRQLRPEIEPLVDGRFAGTARERQVIQVLARVIAAELSFRERDADEAAE